MSLKKVLSPCGKTRLTGLEESGLFDYAKAYPLVVGKKLVKIVQFNTKSI